MYGKMVLAYPVGKDGFACYKYREQPLSAGIAFNPVATPVASICLIGSLLSFCDESNQPFVPALRFFAVCTRRNIRCGNLKGGTFPALEMHLKPFNMHCFRFHLVQLLTENFAAAPLSF